MGNLVCILVWKKLKMTYWREIGEDVLYKREFFMRAGAEMEEMKGKY